MVHILFQKVKWRAIVMGHNTVGLPIRCHQRNRIGCKEYCKKETVQPLETVQVGQCAMQLGKGQMRKNRKGDRMGNMGRNAGKIEPGIFNKLRGVKARRVFQFRAPSCQHNRARGVGGPVMARLQIWHGLATQSQRPGTDIEKVMMRQKPGLSKDLQLNPSGFFPPPTDNGTVPSGGNGRVIEANGFIRIRGQMHHFYRGVAGHLA